MDYQALANLLFPNVTDTPEVVNMDGVADIYNKDVVPLQGLYIAAIVTDI